HTRFSRDWSSDVCSSDLSTTVGLLRAAENPATSAPRRGRNAARASAPAQPQRPFPRRLTCVKSADQSTFLVGDQLSPGTRSVIRSEERRVGTEMSSLPAL